MTSEQRIAEWAEKHFGEMMIEWAEKIGLELIASVRAEAIEECAKVCDAMPPSQFDGMLGLGRTRETSHWDCAEACRALVKERKGDASLGD